jgi:hypothetical protein
MFSLEGCCINMLRELMLNLVWLLRSFFDLGMAKAVFRPTNTSQSLMLILFTGLCEAFKPASPRRLTRIFIPMTVQILHHVRNHIFSRCS